MKTFIALLRGINVSGQKKMPMASLRELCGTLGFHEVQTYIQSGNIVFKSNTKEHSVSGEAIEGRHHDEIWI